MPVMAATAISAAPILASIYTTAATTTAAIHAATAGTATTTARKCSRKLRHQDTTARNVFRGNSSTPGRSSSSSYSCYSGRVASQDVRATLLLSRHFLARCFCPSFFGMPPWLAHHYRDAPGRRPCCRRNNSTTSCRNSDSINSRRCCRCCCLFHALGSQAVRGEFQRGQLGVRLEPRVQPYELIRPVRRH